MDWKKIETDNDLESLVEASNTQPQLVFKHSTQCGVSVNALRNLEHDAKEFKGEFYLLDLLNFRSISNEIAEHFNVRHESPQVLIIKDGRCIYNASHNAINWIAISKLL